MKTRRHFLKTATLSASSMALADLTGRPLLSGGSLKRPNILYFVCHDLGRMIAPYGAKVDTPELQAFADEGATLMQAYCSSPACSPSRACAMTGLHAHKTGLMGVGPGWELQPNEKTIVNYLNDAGYLTAHGGFQHERHRPQYRVGDPNSIDPNGYQEDVRTRADWSGVMVENVVDDAIRWLEKRDPESEQPFYLNLGTQEAHASAFRGRRSETFKRNEVYGVDDPNEVWVPPSMPDNRTSREYFSKMWPCVRHMDREFGRLVKALDSLGFCKNTLVVFTTDHGIFGSRHKGRLFDDGTEIATLVRWKGKIEGGVKIEELIGNIDFCPTLLEAAKVKNSHSLDGKSFFSRLLSQPYVPNESLFMQRNYHAKYDPMRAIREKNFLYIKNFHPEAKYFLTAKEIEALPEPQCHGWPNNRVEGKTPFTDLSMKDWPDRPEEQLYDLRKDPNQLNNVAYHIDYSDTLESMRGRLAKWMRGHRDPLLSGDIPDRRLLASSGQRH